MNKIYKVIWSKVKNCYIVVSELAKRVSRSSSPARAGRASLAAVMAATALTVGTIGMDTAQAATSGKVTQANYIALATHDSNGNPATIPDSIKNGGNYRLVTATVTDAAGNPVYDGNNKMTRTYYVLKGYDVIVHREEQVVDGPTSTYENVIAEVVKNGETIPSNSTLTSAQSIISPIVDGISNDKVRTVLGTSLNSIGMSTYSAATNGGIDAKNTWQYIIEDSNSRWVDVNSNDNNAKRVQVTYNTTDKRYHYTTGTGNSAVDHIVYDEESIYYLSDGNTTNPYVFLRSDGTMYTGTVRGLHNEILMTAVKTEGSSKVMYTYWGAKLNDDETLVSDSDVTVGDLNKAFRTFEANDKNLAQADIANIKLTQQSNGNGGTLGLTRGNDADVLGNVTISSTGGANGQDVKVQFTNTGVKRATQADVTASGGTINLGDYISDPNNVTTFTVDAGSKVVANGGAAHTQGAKLNTLSINGKTYSIVDTDTNNYVTSGSVSYANNGNGTLTLDRQGMADVTITGLQNTYTTGTTIDGNNVKFNRNDGTSYSVNFTAGGGNGTDTYVQVGGNNGIKLNTGSKVVANSGNATQTLNTISINGTSYSLAGGLSIADIGTGYPSERDEEGNVITADETDRHGWTLADTTNPNKFFKDTTLFAGPAGVNITTAGSSESSDDDIPLERDLLIDDTAGNRVTLADVARNSDITTGVTVTGNNNSAKVQFNRNSGKNAYGMNFVGGNNVTIGTNENGDITFSATDTDTNTVTNLTGGTNVTVTGGEADENGVKTYTISATDTNTVTTVSAAQGSNVTVSGATDENGNKTFTISATDTNNYVTSGNVSYDENGAGTLTLTQEGIDNAVTIEGLQNTYTTGATIVGNDVTFSRNDGQSYSVNFTAGGGTNGADTFVQIGGANGLTLNTGSKVVGTGVATPDGGAQALSGITINGEDFLVPTITANTGSNTDEDPYLTSIELNGKTYNILSEGAAKDLTVKAGTYTVVDGTVTMNIVDSLTGNGTQDNVIINGVASVTQLNNLKTDLTTSINNSKTVVESGNNVIISSETDQTTGQVTYTIDGKKTTVSTNDTNLTITAGTEVDGMTDYNVSLNESITLGTDSAKQVMIDGLTGTLKLGNTVVVSTSGINMGSTKITNLAAGVNDTDAVNVSQLKDVQATLTANDQHLVANPDGGNYKVAENKVTLKVQGKDANGETIYTDIVIDDVASKTELDALDTRVTTNETNIKNIQGDIENIEGNITNLDNRVTTNETNIKNIQGDIKNIEGNITNIENKLENKIDSLTDTKLKDGGLTFDKENGDLSMTVTDTSGNTVKGSVNIDEYVSGKINEEAADAKYNDDMSIGEAITANKDAIAQNAIDIVTNKNNIEKNAEAIAKNAEDIATNKDNIEKNAEAIAKNAEDIATNAKDIATNKDNIEKNAEAIAKNAEDIATNASNIASNTGRIETIEDTYVKDITQNGNSLIVTQGDTTKKFTFTDTNTTNANLSNTWNDDDSVTLTLTDSAGNSVSTKIEDVASATELDKEVSDRQAADKALGERIDKETADRIAADEAEAKARQDADKAETEAREAADKALGERIDKEITDRQAADTALGERIDKEITDRQAADTALGERIDKEITDRTVADTALGGRIDKEIIDRQNNDIVAGNIDKTDGTVTLTKGDKSTITVGNICDSRLDSVSYDASSGKMTFTVTDHYNQDEQKTLEVDDIASKKALEKEVSDRQAMDNAIINDYTNKTDALSGQVNSLGHRMTKAVAGAAALAALHPLDFDPDDKLSFSAGVGNYGGSTAAAIGAFYRPNERVMFNIGGTVGNGENMVNAGISFALGKGGNVTASRVAATHEINDLRQQVAYLSAVVAQMAAQTGYQFTDMKPFPDTPENHWAYEYVAKLAAEGIVEGYPNGNFDGDRTMTRYEFAAMLFHALEKGITLDTKIIDEFEPELGRLSVERIKGEQNQKDKIERVRINNSEPDRDAYGGKINVGKNWP